MLRPAYAALPADLHPYVKYDETIEPVRYDVGPRYQPASFDYVPCVDITVRCNRHTCAFIAQRAERICTEDDRIWIEYRDGQWFSDPLMAIAEAASFGPGNAQMEHQCHLMQKSAAGDQFAAQELEDEFGIKPKAPATTPDSVEPPDPTDLENLLADAWRLLDDGDTQGCLAASAVVIAECLHAMSRACRLDF